MQLRALIDELAPSRVHGPIDREIARVVHDSRRAQPQDLFVAIPGLTVDGRRFVPGLKVAAVVAQGAVQAEPGVTVIEVQDAREALARLAAAIHGHPGRAMPVVGITGTNGKTTVAWMLEHICQHAGGTVAALGTTGHRIAGTALPAAHTTPEADVVQALLAQARDAGCTVAIMEASSIGLHARRTDGTPYRVAVFTSFSRDHLDYHGTMAAYLAAKGRLFHQLLDPQGTAVLFGGDPAHVELHPQGTRTWRTGVDQDGVDIEATGLVPSLKGTRAHIRTPAGQGELFVPAVGRHNLENALGAVGAALALDLSLASVLAGLARCPPVPGRLQPVPHQAGQPTVFVDYAHTPDALRRVLGTLRTLTPGALWTVFGCGGDRDAGKRPLMGAAAEAGSDHVVLTSDNPRSEDPRGILAEIAQGMARPSIIEPDRAAAIAWALAHAGPQDVVLIAGKGHEQTQVIGDQVLPFDDCAVAARWLELHP